MANGKRLTNEEALGRILEKCLEKNVTFIGYKNDENVYKNNKTYLILKCNVCGNIWDSTTYDKFTIGNRGCPNCSPTKKKTEKEVVEDINRICKERGFTFLGFNPTFNGIYSKLLLRCNKCGEEWGSTHYNSLRKRESHHCGRKNPTSMPSNLDENKAIEKVKEKLKDSSLDFVSFDEKGFIGRKGSHVYLKCKKCGTINKYTYKYVLSNSISCKKCEYNGKFSNEYATEKVKEKCKYLDYEFLGFDTRDGKYDGKKTYLILKCNKCGRIWKSTKYWDFINKTIKCARCINSWKMEKEIEKCLNEHSIKFIHDCRSRTLPWLKYNISLSLDFYLPEYKIGIECQGRQHFESVLDFGGKKTFEKTIERDKKKLILCKENNVKLLYYDSECGHTEFLGEKVYNDEDNLLKEITSYDKKN